MTLPPTSRTAQPPVYSKPRPIVPILPDVTLIDSHTTGGIAPKQNQLRNGKPFAHLLKRVADTECVPRLKNTMIKTAEHSASMDSGYSEIEPGMRQRARYEQCKAELDGAVFLAETDKINFELNHLDSFNLQLMSAENVGLALIERAISCKNMSMVNYLLNHPRLPLSSNFIDQDRFGNALVRLIRFTSTKEGETEKADKAAARLLEINYQLDVNQAIKPSEDSDSPFLIELPIESSKMQTLLAIIHHPRFDPYAHQGIQLAMAVQSGKNEAVSALLDSKRIDVNAPLLPKGMSALHVAVSQAQDPKIEMTNYWPRKFDSSMTELLIQYGSNVNQPDNEGNTPLHQAVIFNNLTSVRVLLKQDDIEVNPVNNKEETPMSIARAQMFHRVKDSLKEAKAKDPKYCVTAHVLGDWLQICGYSMRRMRKKEREY